MVEIKFFSGTAHPGEVVFSGDGTFGIHFSIISINFFSHMSHVRSTLVLLCRKVQSVASINLLAFSKSA